uniref:(northern house mosquito) hypothetical protein n=1 Tax=Culex pipiens TaxID=7175 RepID=A0A8D8FK46_CULPI
MISSAFVSRWLSQMAPGMGQLSSKCSRCWRGVSGSDRASTVLLRFETSRFWGSGISLPFSSRRSLATDMTKVLWPIVTFPTALIIRLIGSGTEITMVDVRFGLVRTKLDR